MLALHANLIARLKNEKKKLAFCTLSDGTTQPASIYTFLFRYFQVKSNIMQKLGPTVHCQF